MNFLARCCNLHSACYLLTVCTFVVSSELGIIAGWREAERSTGNRVEQAKREVYPHAWADGLRAADAKHRDEGWIPPEDALLWISPQAQQQAQRLINAKIAARKERQ